MQLDAERKYERKATQGWDQFNVLTVQPQSAIDFFYVGAFVYLSTLRPWVKEGDRLLGRVKYVTTHKDGFHKLIWVEKPENESDYA